MVGLSAIKLNLNRILEIKDEKHSAWRHIQTLLQLSKCATLNVDGELIVQAVGFKNRLKSNIQR